MFRNVFRIAAIVIVIISGSLKGQQIRTESMGGLKYSIVDRDLSLTPYDFGKNAAWMFADENETYLRITPAYSNSWGNYRRKYDSEGEMNLGASFHGIKKLGELGTFSGYTSYNYENRRNYYRTLIKDSYSGEGFHLTDSTQSDFRYMGPKVILMYSWEPIKNLFAGGAVSYQLLDGLKEKFSYAKSIFRDTEINIGLAYMFGNGLIFGTSFTYFDSQESIEASDVNLFEVELFYFRGDKYFVSKRSSSMTGKIQKNGITLSSQLCWDDGEKFSVASQINYTPSNSKILKPYSTTSQSFDEVEDSYASFNSLDIQIKTQFKLSDDLLLGGYGAYFYDKSWSRITMKDLLIWDWNVKKTFVGAGISYKASEPLLAAFEYEYSYGKADSSKYIDRRFNAVNTNDHEFRIGAEYKIDDEIFIRGGIKLGKKEYDLTVGGKDCSYYKLGGGFSFPIFNTIMIDTNIQYASINGGISNQSRNYLIGSISITLNTF